MRAGYRVAAAAIALGTGIYLINTHQTPGRLPAAECEQAENVAAVLQSIEQGAGIVLVSDRGDDAIPEPWRDAPVSGSAVAISSGNLCRLAPILAQELEKYPDGVLRNNMSGIYLLERLEFYGVEYGGTSLGDWVYLTGGTIAQGYDDNYLRRLIHHEISSLFFRNYAFPVDTWSAVNPEGFSYATSGGQVLRSIAEGERGGSPALLRQGFLSDYGRSTLENDFNSYAETALVAPGELAALARAYPRVKRKLNILREFYRQVSRGFQFPD
jgi:hypothetical protein